MAVNPDETPLLTCLSTTVRNISGDERTFGFIPPHGRRLKAGQQYSIPGDLATRISGNRRKFDAFQRALDPAVGDPDIALVSTPGVHVYDGTTHATKVLGINNNTLGAVASCTGNYDSDNDYS